MQIHMLKEVLDFEFFQYLLPEDTEKMTAGGCQSILCFLVEV